MKKIILLAFLFLTMKTSQAQFIPVEKESSLKFQIKNLGFGVNGTFSGFHGQINFDPQNLVSSSFKVDLDASSVNTDNRLRDEHLKGESYFNVKSFPKISMVSTEVLENKGVYQFTGQLTIKGITKPISFPFSASPVPNGFLFKGTFKIKRKDFGVGGTSTLSNELEVFINVVARK